MLVLIFGQQKESDKCLRFLLVMCIAHDPQAHVTFFLLPHNPIYSKTFPQKNYCLFSVGDFFSLKNLSLSLSLSMKWVYYK